MIAVDTNILVYAHREDSLFHESAYGCIAGLAEGKPSWAIPWPCIHEFLAIVTHPRIYEPPSPLDKALDQVDAWFESPSLLMIPEATAYWDTLRALISSSKVCGPQIHDARIAALCIQHGITELLTADRDFGRFPELKTRNPLVE
jgi:toxin-antitoxin system PIN domain toxin